MSCDNIYPIYCFKLNLITQRRFSLAVKWFYAARKWCFMQLAAARYRRNRQYFHCPFEGKNVTTEFVWVHVRIWLYTCITILKMFIWRDISPHCKIIFKPYIRRYTSPNETFEYSFLLTTKASLPHSLKTKCITVFPGLA